MHDEGEDEGKVHDEAAVTSSDFPDTVCFAPPPPIEIYVDLDRAFSVKALVSTTKHFLFSSWLQGRPPGLFRRRWGQGQLQRRGQLQPDVRMQANCYFLTGR